MADGKRIAFIRPNKWPLANTKVYEEVKKQFPDHEVDVIDIKPLLKRHPAILVINGLWTLLLYGFDILSGYKKFQEVFWFTPYLFRSVKRLVVQRLSRSKYLFTFQMQSLFDCSLPKVPHFVYTDHTYLANLRYKDFNKNSLVSRRWIELERQIYDNATIAFVRSSNIQQSLIEQYHYPAERVICVYAGSNVNVDGHTIRQKSYGAKNILYVGIDWKRKGGPELVDAFQKILAQHPDANLTIVGAEPKIDVPNCTVLGRLQPEEVAQYYERATIFCLPTHLEPFGIAFLEAMQARLPVIGTRIGAIPDFVHDGWNGFLIEPGDEQGLAEALIKLLDNPDQCREFGERGFALAQERYSWEAVGRRLHQHISKKLS
jgi:glycosyltransferase involved in cell wall biosynthesis